MKSALHTLIVVIAAAATVSCSTVPQKAVLIGTWEPLPSFYKDEHEKRKPSDSGYDSLFALSVYFHFIEENGSIYIEMSTNAAHERRRQWVVVSKNNELLAEPVVSESLPILSIDVHQEPIILRYPNGRTISLRRTKEPNK